MKKIKFEFQVKIYKSWINMLCKDIDNLQEVINKKDKLIDELSEAIDDYEYENGRGDFEAQEKREMNIL